MSKDILENTLSYGPAFLVPSAWLFTLLNHTGFVGSHTIDIMHLVMTGFMALFVFKGWKLMEEGALRLWRNVILAGFLLTAAAAASLFFSAILPKFFLLEMIYWSTVPGVASILTGRMFPETDHLLQLYGAVSVIAGILVSANLFSLNLFIVPAITLVGLTQFLTLFRTLRTN